MICVTKLHRGKQLSLYIDCSKSEIVSYGSMLDIQKYFFSIDIFFQPEETDLARSGWDYVAGDDTIYFVIDVNWKFTGLSIPIFLLYDKLETVVEIASYIKQWIRNDKLNKLICHN